MRKEYGNYREDDCPFCGKRALTMNQQGVPTCKEHSNRYLEIKCVCGEWLDVRKGKFGAYFQCMNCGNISFKKGMSMGSFNDF